MPADPAHQFALPQLGDPEAAVPMSSTEQQAAVVGHHQHLSADLHPGSKRSAQESLRSAPQSGVGWRSELETRHESEEIHTRQIKLSTNV